MADSTLNRFQATGTTAERTAFVPSPPTPASGPDQGYTWFDTDDSTLYAYDFGTAAWVAAGGGSGTVTNTGTLTSGKTIVGNGSADVTVSSLTANLVASSSGALSGAVASANSKLIGSGASGSGAAYAELSLGTNLSMSGTTLNATGGGNTTSTGAEASIPAAGTSGNLYLPDDGFWLQRDSGSAWVPWGPIFPLTDPALSAPTTWVNQGGASVDTTYGGIYLTAPAGAGDNIRARVKTAPATPYVVTAAFLMNVMAVNYPNAGLLFRDSVSGKIVTFAFGAEIAKYTLAVTKYNSATSYNASYVAPNWWPVTVAWLRIADNGTNRICSYSSDGQHWQVLHSVGRTDFMTADQVGFYANANNATYATDLTLLSWKET